VSYKTPEGESKEESFLELEAVAIQHEIDHLDGVTILDKVSRLKRDIYLRKIKKIRRKIKHRIEQNNRLYY
jgi:peptide deformylase